MKLPTLSVPAQSRTVITAFGGINHTPTCGEGEFYRQKNLSGSASPAVTTRPARRLLRTLAKPNGLFYAEGPLWVDGTGLWYKNRLAGRVQDSPKQFCALGSRVLIWPDKVAFDTETGTLSPLGAKWQASGSVRVVPAREDGSAYGEFFTADTAPDPAQHPLWALPKENGAALYEYSAAAGEWTALSTVYTRLEAAGIGRAFARYDTVTVSGVSGDWADRLNGERSLWRCEENAVCFVGGGHLPHTLTAAEGTPVLERRVPDLDYLTQLGNRVWGCSSREHCIYACRQGDPTNWFSYLGVASDSYAATVGTPGDFTGAAACLGYVLFFKENALHKVYGSQPANFQVNTVTCRGVQQGCAGSLAAAGESLFYKSRDGICRYDGGLPDLVSGCLGEDRFSAAVGGAGFGGYRVSMRDETGGWHLFCCRLDKNLWSREDELQAVAFARGGTDCLCLAADGRLLELAGDPEDERVDWSGELGPMGLYTADHRRVRRIELNLDSQPGNRITVEARYDSDRHWEQLGTTVTGSGGRLRIPITPRRCAVLRLRVSGTAPALLYSIGKVTEKGSELAWQT